MLEGMVREATVETRFYAAVLALFGGVGLLLAAVGVYGVVAQSVTERMREFGVRIALGATGARLLRMVLVQTAAALATGAAVGVATATYVTPLVQSWLFGVQPNDTSTLVSVGVGFVAIGLAAAWRPASLAARADPLEALRLE
jgi:ABC-type antimicrobial peptide transport system permease subunit